jgi:hypothetical protein
MTSRQFHAEVFHAVPFHAEVFQAEVFHADVWKSGAKVVGSCERVAGPE